MDISPETIERFNQNPLYQTVGIRLGRVVEGRADSVLKPESRICWPFPDQPHGGMLFTLMDTTMAWAVMSRLDPGFSCTTIDLTIQYLAPAKYGPFSCRAEAFHRTRHLSFVRAEVLDAKAQPIASGQSTFRIIKMDLA